MNDKNDWSPDELYPVEKKTDAVKKTDISINLIKTLGRQNAYKSQGIELSPEAQEIIAPKLNPVCAWGIEQMPPPREWAWKPWAATGTVTGLGGAPGVGKSTIAQQIATHKAIGKAYLDGNMEQAPALYLTCEDSQDELSRRQFAINEALDITMKELQNLFLLSRIGDDSMLVELKNSVFMRTVFFDQVDEMLGDLKIKLAFFDLIPDFWNGNEIVRQHVNAYIKTHLGYLADRHQCAVVGLYHPSQAGKNSGTGESGSTAWEGSFRSRIYIEREAGSLERTITRKKSNYSEINDGVKVTWDKGYFMEVNKMKTSPSDQAEEMVKNAFMQIMNHCELNNIDVSPAANSKQYYGKTFPLMWRELDKRHLFISQAKFEKAFTQLQFKGMIEITDATRVKRPRIRIRKG